jgi:hypothetical protein
MMKNPIDETIKEIAEVPITPFLSSSLLKNQKKAVSIP